MPGRLNLDEKRIIELYTKKDMTTTEIAEFMGCNWDTIRKRLIKLGVKIREPNIRKGRFKGPKHFNFKSLLVKCATCGKKFYRSPYKIKHRKHQFCSPKCYYTYLKKTIPKNEVVCENCGKKFFRTPWKVRHYKHNFCSAKCQNEYRTKKTGPKKVRCAYCGKIIKRHRYRLKQYKLFFCNSLHRRMLQSFPTKATKIELKMRRELKNRKFKFKINYPVLGICQPDIVFPKKKTAIFCDGDYWHGNKRRYRKLNKMQINQIKRDRIQEKILKKDGWKILRFWESDINKDIGRCVKKIGKAIRKLK